MSLKNVKGFGTEGRRNGESEIPPSENILGTVKFRVDLVKTFEIIEKKSEEEEEEEETVDPAIISTEEETKKESKKDGKNDDWSIGTKAVKKSSEENGDSEPQERQKQPYVKGVSNPVN